MALVLLKLLMLALCVVTSMFDCATSTGDRVDTKTENKRDPQCLPDDPASAFSPQSQ